MEPAHHPADEAADHTGSAAPNRPASPETRASQAAELVRNLNATLIRSLQLRLGSYEDAREVAQEAYSRLLNLGNDQVISFQRALLFKIAQNLATDLLRRRAYTELPEPDGLDLWPDPGADPERSARARWVVERLPAVLAELPPKCADAFRLVRMEQRSFKEAAERLALTDRMVRIHVARALAFCQMRFDELTDEQEGADHA
ncbi:RNA polymerase sigma factor [Pseudoxanthomonas japonensis]|uniref:RNA polymerase subunit sigma n=1 Tax=Pseudoxanthomonas japonensis TaxID=69284 RepID=A0ABQ6ZFU3_9GAMM|nr:RNA polymerase sigma factor [Pseudoxanthomonas japonensis]KAF1724473.1 RNA polymerase subunit sigma [Pseudoxanthomonas japonensis]